MKDSKLIISIENLEAALKFKDKAISDPVYYAAIVKCYEVCFEYAWKYFKRIASQEGLEVFSPRESVKAAGRLGIISDLELWLDDLENRNLSVHDYIGISEQEYIDSIISFLARVKNI